MDLKRRPALQRKGLSKVSNMGSNVLQFSYWNSAAQSSHAILSQSSREPCASSASHRFACWAAHDLVMCPVNIDFKASR